MLAPSVEFHGGPLVLGVLRDHEVQRLVRTRPDLGAALVRWQHPRTATWALVGTESHDDLAALEFLYVASRRVGERDAPSFLGLRDELRRLTDEDAR